MMRISEVLPNPVGSDKVGEYIILTNDATSSQSLSGWKIKDKSGKTFSLNGYAIEPGQGMRFSASVSKLTLNNSDEVVELLNPAGQVVDRLSYAQSAEGQPILQGGALSTSIREQLFDELAARPTEGLRSFGQGPGKSVDEYMASAAGGSFWPVLIVCAIVLAVGAVYVIRKVGLDKKDVQDGD